MAKYPHTKDTLIVLNDIANRVQQLIEASELTLGGEHDQLAQNQIMAFQAVQTIIQQCKNNGHVFRGSSAVPDGLEPYVKTPSPMERVG